MSFAFAPGETEIRRWRVSRRSLAWRTAALLLATLIALTPLAYYTTWAGWAVSAAILLPLYMWVFDDFKIWRENARTVWLLTDQALHIDAPDDEDAPALRLPLEQIASVSRWPLWSVVLRLQSGVALTLPLAPQPRRLRVEILAARATLVNR
jgi:hypothetical protein